MAFGSIALRLSPARKVQVPGDTVRVTATFSADMVGTGVRFRVAFPSGIVADHILGIQGDIVQESGTIYHLDFVVEAQGTHRVRVEGSGAVDGAIELEFEGDESIWYTSIPRLITEPIGPGLPGEVIGWIDDGVTEGHWGRQSGGGGGSATPGGLNGNVQYNNNGVLDGASDVKIVNAEQSLAFSGSSASFPAATAGTERFAADRASVYARDSFNTKNVSIWTYNVVNSDYLLFGDNTNLGSVGIAASTSFGIYIASLGVEEYQFNASGALWRGSNYQAFGDTPATAGTERFTNLSTVYARDSLDTKNLRVLEMGNDLSLGDGTAGGDLYYDVGPGKRHIFRVAGVGEFVGDATKWDLKTNYIVHGTNYSTNGILNAENGVVLVGARNVANTGDIEALRVDNVDKVFVGGSVNAAAIVTSSKTGGFWENRVNNVAVQHFDDVTANFIGTVARFGTNPGGVGYIGVPGSTQVIISQRNILNTQNMVVLQSDNADGLVLGDNTYTTNLLYGAKAGGSHKFQDGNTDRLTINRDRLQLTNSVTPPTTDPSGGGYIYEDTGSLTHRGSSGTVTAMGAA